MARATPGFVSLTEALALTTPAESTSSIGSSGSPKLKSPAAWRSATPRCGESWPPISTGNRPGPLPYADLPKAHGTLHPPWAQGVGRSNRLALASSKALHPKGMLHLFGAPGENIRFVMEYFLPDFVLVQERGRWSWICYEQ